MVKAVEDGNFRIIAIDHVLEGIEYLTGVPAGSQNKAGSYAAKTVMGHAEASLAAYRKTLESNQPQKRV